MELNLDEPSWTLLMSLEHAMMHCGCILRRLPYLRQIVSSNQPLSTAPVRCLSRDIGQPTNFTHPELIKDGESQYINC